MRLNKKVIYFYFDEQGNKRPIDMVLNDGFDLLTNAEQIKLSIETLPKLKNNFYALVDGIIFKLD